MIDVVKVVVENSDGLILAVREKESGNWELPGGKIRDSEDRFEAAERELLEETGLESSSFKDVVRVEVEDSQCVNCFILYTNIVDNSVNVELDKDELDEFKWVEPEEYKNLDWHSDSGYGIPAVEKLEEYLG